MTSRTQFQTTWLDMGLITYDYLQTQYHAMHWLRQSRCSISPVYISYIRVCKYRRNLNRVTCLQRISDQPLKCAVLNFSRRQFSTLSRILLGTPLLSMCRYREFEWNYFNSFTLVNGFTIVLRQTLDIQWYICWIYHGLDFVYICELVY